MQMTFVFMVLIVFQHSNNVQHKLINNSNLVKGVNQ